MLHSKVLFNYPIPVLRKANKYPHFDLCVIGGGPGGVAGAIRAVSFGKKVCIVEQSPHIGGLDVWGGTIPSKTLWEISKSVSRMTNPNVIGRFMDPALMKQMAPKVDSNLVLKTIDDVSRTKEKQVLEFIKDAGVEIIHGKASFANDHEIDVYSGKGEYQAITSDYFLIATGSTPRDHPLHPCDHKIVCFSDDMFRLPLPKSIVIIGAGPMGCEFASMLSNFGTIKVYLIDKAQRILSKEDEDVSRLVQERLMARGVTIHQDSQLFDLETYVDPETKQGYAQYSIQNLKTGTIETLIVDRALVAMGRSANYRGLGIENTEMRIKDGVIECDAFRRCKPYDHIYCIGDASNDLRVVPMAQAAARAAIQSIYGATPPQVVHSKTLSNVSSGWFFDEEVAAIGLNEKQCRDQQIAYVVAKYEYSHVTRSIISGDTIGFVKLLVSNDRQKRVLGVRAMGAHAGSVVEIVSLAIRNKESVYDLLKLNSAYPSMVLGLVECARMLVGRGSRQGSMEGPVTIQSWKPDHFSRGRAFSNAVKLAAEEK